MNMDDDHRPEPSRSNADAISALPEAAIDTDEAALKEVIGLVIPDIAKLNEHIGDWKNTGNEIISRLRRLLNDAKLTAIDISTFDNNSRYTATADISEEVANEFARLINSKLANIGKSSLLTVTVQHVGYKHATSSEYVLRVEVPHRMKKAEALGAGDTHLWQEPDQRDAQTVMMQVATPEGEDVQIERQIAAATSIFELMQVFQRLSDAQTFVKSPVGTRIDSTRVYRKLLAVRETVSDVRFAKWPTDKVRGLLADLNLPAHFGIDALVRNEIQTILDAVRALDDPTTTIGACEKLLVNLSNITGFRFVREGGGGEWTPQKIVERIQTSKQFAQVGNKYYAETTLPRMFGLREKMLVSLPKEAEKPKQAGLFSRIRQIFSGKRA